MRKKYHGVLKVYFNRELIRRRTELCLTQAQMAEQLLMDDRSYIDLDHGKSCCSAITLAIYLAFICDDVYGFVEGLRYAFNIAKENAA